MRFKFSGGKMAWISFNLLFSWRFFAVSLHEELKNRKNVFKKKPKISTNPQQMCFFSP
jgi:hypothetical protein